MFSSPKSTVHTIPVGSQPTGVAVDAEGKVWTVDFGDENIHRIDPAYNAVDLTKRILGTTHYGYSDMTGMIVRNSTTRIGTWTVIHNARVVNTPWGFVFWTANEPDGTSIRIRVRSSNNRTVWSTWETAVNGAPLYTTPPGKFLEIEVTIQSAVAGVTPALLDLSIQPALTASYGHLVYFNDFEATAGPAWSTNTIESTPVGENHFFGQFGNQTVTLALSNLPPHAAVTVMADVYAIRSWDGNNTNDGPDLFELNVAGGLKLVHSTFNNGPTNSLAAGQAYPEQYPASVNAPRTGATATNTLGFTVPGQGVMDSTYHLVYSVPHSTDWLVLNFLAAGLNPSLAEESWGLDNVKVYLIPREGPPRLLPLIFSPSGFTFYLRNEPGWSYVIQGSPDLISWTDLQTNRPNTNLLHVLDPTSLPFPQRFYRAIQKP